MDEVIVTLRILCVNFAGFAILRFCPDSYRDAKDAKNRKVRKELIRESIIFFK
jgi:hypothetical protein